MYYDFQEVEICISLVFKSYKTNPIMAIDNFPWTMFLRCTLNVKILHNLHQMRYCLGVFKLQTIFSPNKT
jgi:hypothetical protein